MKPKTGSVHWSFWAIGAIALIWNLLGVMNYLGQMNADTLAALPENHRALIETRPAWATGAFAIAVFGGVLGSLLLLLKRSIAVYLFIVSLLGVIIQLIPSVQLAASAVKFSLAEVVLAFLMPPIVASFLLWYSKFAARKNWTR